MLLIYLGGVRSTGLMMHARESRSIVYQSMYAPTHTYTPFKLRLYAHIHMHTPTLTHLFNLTTGMLKRPVAGSTPPDSAQERRMSRMACAM